MMEAKLAQLEFATASAKAESVRLASELEDATRQLNEEKDRLRSLSSEEQQKILINDTNLPELLEAYSEAKNAHETARARYETNARYVGILRRKMGLPSKDAEAGESQGESEETSSTLA